MAPKKLHDLQESATQLRAAIDLFRDSSKKQADLHFLTISKAFEILVEVAWKHLKQRVQDEGLDAPSPKEAIRQATRIKFISDPEFWIACINARNDSVHNYFGISKKDYVELAEKFLEVICHYIKQ